MGKRQRSAAIFLLFLALLCLPVMGASAAVKAPAKVTALKIDRKGETMVRLVWGRAARAQQYVVFRVDPKTGKKTKVGSTPGTYYRVQRLKPGVKYYFTVRPYNKAGSKFQWAKEYSNVVSATLKMYTPGKVSGLTAVSYGGSSITLKWNAASYATGYQIFQYDAKTKTYTKIAATSANTYTVKGLTDGKTYQFQIRPTRTVGSLKTYGEYSAAVKAKVKAVDMSNVHGRYYDAVIRSDVTVTLSNGKKQTLKRGTRVIAKSKKANVEIIVSNQYTATVPYSRLIYGNLHTTTTYYTKEQAEMFVNKKGYSSQTGSLIWISQYTLALYVFKGSQGNWRLVRTMPCVVGYKGHTPVREFRIVKIGQAYGNVCLYFTWNGLTGLGYAIHRRTTAGVTRAASSGGCIRLGDADLAYVYQNCPLLTKVVSY